MPYTPPPGETATQRVLRKAARNQRIAQLRCELRTATGFDRSEAIKELDELETAAREEAEWEKSSLRRPVGRCVTSSNW